MKSSPRADPAFDVIMLTTVHRAADPRIFHREAKTLAAAGLAVCIIGQHPKSEFLDGVWIDALPRPASRLARLRLSYRLLQRAQELGSKLYIFHDPELFMAALVLRFLGRKVIYDCHENTPMTMLAKAWIPAPLRLLAVPLIAAVEWLGSRLLTGVVVVNESLLKRFPHKRTIVVRNLPPALVVDTTAGGSPLDSRSEAAIYAGGLSRIRGVGELVEAFRGINSGAELWLVGEFSDVLFERKILDSLPPNVKWLGHKEYPEVLQLYRKAKLGVVLMHDTPSHHKTMPIKLFEYLGAGLPVLASDMPQFAPLLEGCGVQVNPKDVAQVRSALEQMLSDKAAMVEMSRVGRERISKFFRWEDDGRRLLDFCTLVGAIEPGVRLSGDEAWKKTEALFDSDG